MMPNGKDIIDTLVKLLEAQEGIRITYKTTGGTDEKE